jgi:hypothetical protein
MGVGRRREGSAELLQGVDELLVIAIDQDNGCLGSFESKGRLRVEGPKVALAHGGRSREGLKNYASAIEFAIDVLGKICRDLHDTALGLDLTKRRHAVQSKDRQGQEGKRECKREQEQKCPDPLRRHTIGEQSRWHLPELGMRPQ